MVKKMGYNWKSWWRPLHKNNYLVIKLGVSVLLVGLAFTLLFNRSSDFPPISETPFLQNPHISESPVHSQQNSDQIPPQENEREESFDSEGKCNVFRGDWVPDEAGPFYTNTSCSHIETHQNCMKNGRPDTDYLYWRWKPHGCELTRVDPKKFLEFVRNKNWGFIGDSISRNHVQSFLCVLSTVEEAKEVYHDESYKSRRWFFPSHNFTVSVLWAPFLAKAEIFEDMNGVSTSEIKLHLDILDKNWTEQYNTFDYTIFSGGKWFTKTAIYYENATILGCHSCPQAKNFTDIGFNFAYRKVMRNLFNYIATKSSTKGVIFYRTSTPDHFEGGEWFSGGSCTRKFPSKKGEFELKDLVRILREIELDEFEKASFKASENGVNLRLFDVNPMLLLRPDGHPGPYRFYQPFGKDKNATVINDCLHWCLPGPIDSWNDLLMETLLNG